MKIFVWLCLPLISIISQIKENSVHLHFELIREKAVVLGPLRCAGLGCSSAPDPAPDPAAAAFQCSRVNGRAKMFYFAPSASVFGFKGGRGQFVKKKKKLCVLFPPDFFFLSPPSPNLVALSVSLTRHLIPLPPCPPHLREGLPSSRPLPFFPFLSHASVSLTVPDAPAAGFFSPPLGSFLRSTLISFQGRLIRESSVSPSQRSERNGAPAGSASRWDGSPRGALCVSSGFSSSTEGGHGSERDLTSLPEDRGMDEVLSGGPRRSQEPGASFQSSAV